MSKKTQALFRKQFQALISGFVVTETDGKGAYKWEVMTKAGNLKITLHDDAYKIFAVYMKFDEPTRAADYFKSHYLDIENLNQYSGKYNHYHDDIDFLLDRIKVRLNKLI